jgi:hypothetical protein
VNVLSEVAVKVEMVVGVVGSAVEKSAEVAHKVAVVNTDSNGGARLDMEEWKMAIVEANDSPDSPAINKNEEEQVKKLASDVRFRIVRR